MRWKSPLCERKGLFNNIRLHRLTGGNVVLFDLGLLAPFEDGHAGHLRAIVGDDRLGLTRLAIRLSSSWATQALDRDVSVTRHRHSRVKSSTTTRTRKPRPSVKASLTKFRLQRSLRREGRARGHLVPKARFRPPRLRKVSFSFTIEIA